MDSQQSIFRKTALDNLSSPEQLDQLMQVTTPKGWISLMACVALVVTAIVWSVMGTIPTKVGARGILIKRGGIFIATSRGDGNVVDILVKPGDTVAVKQVLTHVSQPELKLRLVQNEESLTRLRQELEQLRVIQKSEKVPEAESFSMQRVIYDALIADFNTQIAWLNQRVEVQGELLKKQLSTTNQVLDARIRLFTVQHEREQAGIQRRQIELSELQADERRRQQLQEKEKEIKLAENLSVYLHSLHELNSEIRSPFRGTVLEIMVKEGQLLTPNTPIMSLQDYEPTLEAHVFLSPSDGKLVSRGMPVTITPDFVKQEEYGQMRGEVTSVSEFPVTPQGMLRVLENPSLVADFARNGAPIEVTVALTLATNTFSGFSWTSGRGPRLAVGSGSLCNAAVTITNQRPISMVLPTIKNRLGM
ncbi:MAG: NHLP bacteriocin system secretion protein [Pedosphaera sp.]|nr:NHLP bacteriocin system secretion protein [Pedosphaera sp.]